MKPRDIYSSYFLVAGVMCLILGLGNWIVGAVETARYQGLLQKTAQTGLEESYRSFQSWTIRKMRRCFGRSRRTVRSTMRPGSSSISSM